VKIARPVGRVLVERFNGLIPGRGVVVGFVTFDYCFFRWAGWGVCERCGRLCLQFSDGRFGGVTVEGVVCVGVVGRWFREDGR